MGHGGSVVYPWIICFKGRETPWIGCCQKLEPFGDAVLQLPLNCGRKLHEQKENTQTPHRMDRSFNALIEVLSWKPLPSQRRLLRPPLLALFSSSVLCIISLLNPNLQLCTFTHLLQWVDLARKTLTRSSTRSRSKLLSNLFRPTYRNGDVPWWFAVHLYLLPNLGWLLWWPMCCLWYTSPGQAVLLSRPSKPRSSHDQNHTHTHTRTMSN